MAFDNIEDPGEGGGGSGGYAPSMPGNYLTYEFLGYDPNMVAVYRGSDGNLYTDGPGPNGFVGYSGPGVGGGEPPPPDDLPDRADAGEPPPPTPTPTPSPTPPPTYSPPPLIGPAPPPSGTGSIGEIAAGGSPLAGFPGTFTPPSSQALPSAPGFAPPAITTPPPFSFGEFVSPVGTPEAFSYEAFRAPDPQQALNDPAYLFRKAQGEASLQNWAAARGTLNDTGTAKALLEYGGAAASQEYGDIFKRAFDTYGANRANAADIYNTNLVSQFRDPYQRAFDTYATNRANAMDVYNQNYKTQYADPYQNAYTAAHDQYLGDLSAYQVGTQAVQRQNEQDYQNAWNRYLQDYNIFTETQDRNFDKRYRYATV